ncbi:MAG: hypothetical protein ACWA5R_11655 [bacterium]
MLDQSRFRELESLNDEDGQFLKDLLKDYDSDCDRNFIFLKQSFANNDCKAFREACHALKNVGGSVAASQLTSVSGKYMLATDAEILKNGKDIIDELTLLREQTWTALNEAIN